MTPRIRQSIYLVGTIASAAVALVALWNGITAETAASITDTVQAVVGLFGTAASATATATVSKQRKAGTFDKQPVAETVVNGVQAVIEAHEAATKDLEQVKNAVAGAAGAGVPGTGPLAQQAIQQFRRFPATPTDPAPAPPLQTRYV
ncbi:holin [Mycobacterium phage Nairb]|uniref:Holin n=5 Tax=Bernalvirus bernal13 TaxID=1982102 RepID=A0A2P1JRQ2_9CAUD|nr:holin [Mycobacterium phage Bernal13]AIT13441.1 holin [Mycobacterium phage RonRayGun]ASJ79109.1 holin [Mycobacterium phage ZenTime222]AVO21816.1 holin [Mycobacterium phage Nairb]QBP28873.1 holin [Mycobacterium phage Ibrahim]QHB47434.1 holin [Mycobacterium phage Whitty]